MSHQRGVNISLTVVMGTIQAWCYKLKELFHDTMTLYNLRSYMYIKWTVFFMYIHVATVSVKSVWLKLGRSKVPFSSLRGFYFYNENTPTITIDMLHTHTHTKHFHT